MPIANNPPDNSNSTLFKFILIIFVILFMFIILRESLHLSIQVTSFAVNLLHNINSQKELISVIKMFLPAIKIIVANLILFLFLSFILYILDKTYIDLREKLINYLTYKGWKIDFYRLILYLKHMDKSLFSIRYYSDSKILNRISSPDSLILLLIYSLMLFFVLCFINVSYVGEDIFGVNIIESQNLSNYIENNLEIFEFKIILINNILVSLINTIVLFWGLLIFIEMTPRSIIKYLFCKETGVVDVSDLPISFIKAAIQQLEAVDFSESFDQIQGKKNQISNLINNSLYFIKVDKEKTYVNYMNFCFLKCHGLLNKNARDDIRFRLNGLSEKMNNVLININHMNCVEDKNRITKDLETCLKVIENRDLSKIDPKEFVTGELTIDKVFSFFFKSVLLPVTLVILTQMII